MSRRITQSEWNAFVARQPHADFLQSWEWGENAYREDQTDILRITYPDTGDIRACCQLIQRGEGTPFHYWYAPGGPIAESTTDAEAALLQMIAEARLRFAPFLRIEPTHALLDVRRFVRVAADRPSTTRILDLSRGDDFVFDALHEKTRYNIRLAERKGVVIREIFSVGEDHPDREFFETCMKRFRDLLRETARRGDFSLHPWVHYGHLIDSFSRAGAEIVIEPNTPAIRFYTAWYDSNMIAATLCMAFGDTVSYLHGASSYDHRAVMAPALLQWHAIRDAAERGYRYYDLWGVAPKGAAPDNPWAGFTRFKEGFGGQIVTYPGTFDIPLRPIQYWMYSFGRSINRFLRRPIR
ncbi:peptidoglycan bridge formation glycyltransferase FemA/FemB family protein [Candidatus Uhrbacteria bacterium]|nr:peptidoglycan bridge formation glycyltransferase FemA/FemB family protein [Candidatus Uhrbacteria bacterium]